MNRISVVFLATVAATAAGCRSASTPGESVVETAAVEVPAARTSASSVQREQVSRMIGLDLADQLAPIRDEVDLDIALRTMRERLAGKAPPLSDSELAEVRREFAAHLRGVREQERHRLIAKNQDASDRFFAANAKRPGVVTTRSGLQYEVLRDAAGPRPVADDTVRVHYVGTHLDGTPFDNSYERDHPVEVVLNQVIAGWREGLALMPAGARFRLWLPGKLAYGDTGKPGELEPNAALVFDIELLEIAGHPVPETSAAALSRE